MSFAEKQPKSMLVSAIKQIPPIEVAALQTAKCGDVSFENLVRDGPLSPRILSPGPATICDRVGL